jgi:hypothetical protein
MKNGSDEVEDLQKVESCGWEKTKLGFGKWNFSIYSSGKIIIIIIN